MGLELQTIALTGHGIERKLDINESSIKFLPTIPYMEIQEREFTIENNCEYPIEFFWHHLDDRFIHEDLIAKILTHYYDVKEILLPPRKVAEGIPTILIEFYNDLVNEIAKEQKSDEINYIEEEEEEDDQRVLNKEINKKTSIAKKKKKQNKRLGDVSLKLKLRKVSNLKRKKSLNGSVTLWDIKKDRPSMIDQLNIEKLLLDHISNLHKGPNFHKTMKDPVKCLFDELELQSMLTEKLEESEKPEKKVCIIFHGAPFTAYQETACRSARALGIPVLSIDTAILEIAAFSKSECSVKLRQAINEIYQNYTSKFSENRIQILAEKLETTRTQKSRSSQKRKKSGETQRTTETSISEKHDNDLIEEERFLHWTDEPDPLESYDKLSLTEETLISMDILSQYEHKLEAIRLLEKIFPTKMITDTIKDKTNFHESDKSSKKSQRNFLEIGSDILFEALRERLSEEDFERGFVLQTLHNSTICDEIKTLNILLDIVGHIEFFLFITFYNSEDICNWKIKQYLKEIKMLFFFFYPFLFIYIYTCI
ncbi:hydrocephalus-inducing protein homolog [Vespula pensylvanica]|uniref:hydrocephalus-inducing protein homolog n=1 Tax=Vespula pensylvanica TaxID=30213 RepID=UPI001CBA2982|nr:hydrocephalus-inducing protein homolog [Vespula pensylvanica]